MCKTLFPNIAELYFSSGVWDFPLRTHILFFHVCLKPISLLFLYLLFPLASSLLFSCAIYICMDFPFLTVCNSHISKIDKKTYQALPLSLRILLGPQGP